MKKLDDKFISKIAENVYLINEFGGTNCYLVVGSKRALLIDCGTGICDMNDAVRRITDLPFDVVATHGHVDHIGGCGQFDKIYVHKDDCKTINRIQNTLLMRQLFVTHSPVFDFYGITKDDVFKPFRKTKIVEIDENYTFDLSDKIIRVKSTPGHSPGSIALIDDADGIIFSGDNVCDSLWMQLPGSTSIEEWIPGAQWLYSNSEKYRVFWGHRTPELSHEYIGQVISWGEKILQKYPKNSLISKKVQYPLPDGIIFKTGKVHSK